METAALSAESDVNFGWKSVHRYTARVLPPRIIFSTIFLYGLGHIVYTFGRQLGKDNETKIETMDSVRKTPTVDSA